MHCQSTKEPEITQAVSNGHPRSVLALMSPEEIAVLPKSVIIQLSSPAPEGDRRRQMKPVVIAMTANGFEPERMYELVRSMYEVTFTNQEIWSFIKWSLKHKDKWKPSGEFVGSEHTPTRRELSKEERVANAEKFLAGFRCTPDDLIAKSKVRIPSDPTETACLYLYHMYSLADLLNLVLDYKLDKDGKPHPYGAGITRSVYQWRMLIDRDGVPHSDAGCKFRLNPVRPANLSSAVWRDWCGSGYEGAYTNGDVEQAAYVMLESDLLSMDIQASVLGKLPLPIKAIIDTGNRSLHGNVALTSGAEQARAILNELYVLGFDSNPSISCLERLPGDIRVIGARDHTGTEHRLLYLSPKPTKEPIFT
jgi:hypothetical protein